MASYHLQAVASHLVRCDESANVNTTSTPLWDPKTVAYAVNCARFSVRIHQSCGSAARSWKALKSIYLLYVRSSGQLLPDHGTKKRLCSPDSYVANTYVAL